MTQKDKQLLLKDLSTRIPFGVKVQYTAGDGTHIDCDIDYVSTRSQCAAISDSVEKPFVWRSVENIKLYLRPMSSMTKEEKNEYELFYCYGEHDWDNYTGEEEIPNIVDWLNEHHFDYRGLIEKGLAIAVTKENNPYED